MTPGTRLPGTVHTWQWSSRNDCSHKARLCCRTGQRSRPASADAESALPPRGLDSPRQESSSKRDRDLKNAGISLLLGTTNWLPREPQHAIELAPLFLTDGNTACNEYE